MQARFRLKEDGSLFAWRDLVKCAFDGVLWSSEAEVERLKAEIEKSTLALGDPDTEDKPSWVKHSKESREALKEAERAIQNVKVGLKGLLNELTPEEEVDWKAKKAMFHDYMVLESLKAPDSKEPSEVGDSKASLGGSQ